jgi:uncharacterized cupredoxin-like copper-binding protein
MHRIATRRTFVALPIVALPIVVLVMSACTTAPAATGVASASPSESPAPGAIAVTLQEWAVVPTSTSTAAGDVTFQVTNTGPDDVHEFVVLKTELDAGALPTDATGTVTEAGSGIEVIGEIEDIAVGDSRELTVTLEAGKYVLLCNIYDETEKEAHYRMGMRTPFEVTG